MTKNELIRIEQLFNRLDDLQKKINGLRCASLRTTALQYRESMKVLEVEVGLVMNGLNRLVNKDAEPIESILGIEKSTEEVLEEPQEELTDENHWRIHSEYK